jgi:threonine synthase
METTAAFDGFVCLDCGERAEGIARCPDCGGRLDATYSGEPDDPGAGGVWDCGAPLPVGPGDAGGTEPGGTPLIDCPALAEEATIADFYVKDEGRNPSGSLADRGQALAVAAAAAAGETDAAIPTPGGSGQALAAHAARAGLESHSFVPTRAPFVNKAMVNVHGGDMRVVEGRYPDAVEAFEGTEHYSTRPFDSPLVHEGAKTLLYETVAAADPDHVVVPSGHGATLYGLWKASGELGVSPALHAAQPAGCAPLVDAFESGGDVEPWGTPDTVCGAVEIPEPEGGDLALEAVRESGGRAVAVEDRDAMGSAVTVAQHEGIGMSPSSGVAAAAAWELADDGTVAPDESLVVVNAAEATAAGDVLRSHLMGQGV